MSIRIEELGAGTLPGAARVWNQVVEDGEAFPQLDYLEGEKAAAFFAEQSFTGVAVDEESGAVAGLYILHPNNVGRCGHIANASYAVDRDRKGLRIGEAPVPLRRSPFERKSKLRTFSDGWRHLRMLLRL